VSSTLPEQPVSLPLRSVTRLPSIAELRAAAIRYSLAGWPILPVRPPAADRPIIGFSPADPKTAGEWWADRPYGIACRTGVLFDVVQVPRWLGRLLLPAAGPHATVIEAARALDAVWLFLVTPNAPGIPDLPRHAGVRLHGAGSWVLLPPTPTPGGSVSWIAGGCDLPLPHSLALQWAITRVASGARRERPAPQRARRRNRT
jgi:hypothetical protein